MSVKFTTSISVITRAMIVLFVVAGQAAPVQAQQCSFSITDVNFGAVNLTQGNVIDVTATFTATCGGLLTTVRVCPNIGSGSGGADSSGSPRYMQSGVNQLAFNLYQDAARSIVWGSTLDGAGTNPPTLDIPVLLFGNTTSRTIYGRIFANQQTVSTGSFLSSFSGGHTLIAYRNGTSQTCAQIGTLNGVQAPFNVQATHLPSCTVSATSMNFGVVSGTDLVAGGQTAQSTITATCSAGTPYTISLNGGTTNASDPTARKMTLLTSAVTYGLYQDLPHTLPWGNVAGSNTVAGSGTGASQPHTVYGLIQPQPVTLPGVYNDTVVVTLSY